MTNRQLISLRRKLDLTQNEFGRMVGCSGAAICRYEAANRPIPKWLPLMLAHIKKERATRY